MATVKFLNNILSKDVNTFSVEDGISIESIIRENVDENTYKETLVECYDLETGKTYFAPLEENEQSINAIVLVNGKDADVNYKVQENDLVEIVITPAGGGGGWNWWGAVVGIFEGIFAGAYLSGGNWVGALIGGVIGFFAGGIVGGIIADSIKVDTNQTHNKGIDSEKLPDVRGATNQPLTNQSYPCVLGKHLAVPFIVGSPCNDISGAHGEENYISVLYAVGYGPLRLTDFKLGEQYIAHNQRWSGNPDLKNIWSGTLHGTDTDDSSTSDSGEIANVWKSNDVTIEILQQTPDEPVNYGAVYPYAKLQKDIKANVLFIADGSLEEIDKGNNISYKGLGLQNGLRNNPIYFSEQFAKSLKVELDFASGLYKSRSETVNSVSDVHYYKIPMWVAIQWRVYSEDNDKADGSYAGNMSLPTYDYQNHKYNLIDGKAKRGWNSFSEINSVNMNWSGRTKPYIRVYYMFTYNSDTTSSSYGYTLLVKTIEATEEYVDDFIIRLEYKGGTKTYTFPAHTTRMEINEAFHTSGQYLSMRVIPDGVHYGGGTASSTGCGEERIGFFTKKYPLTVCVGNGIKATQYTAAKRTEDFDAHTGNTLPDLLNDGWLNKLAFNLQPLCGDDLDETGINEFRCITEVDLVEWAEKNLRTAGDSEEEFVNKFKSYFYDSSNSTKSIEVRVVRISPNYLDETTSTNEHSAFKFNDLFTWTTLTSTMLDGDELLKSSSPSIVQKRPLTEDDMRKLCVVALKAKTDNVDQLSNTIKKFSCIAESFTPYYDDTQKKWLPKNVVCQKKYVKLVDGSWVPITENQYYTERQNGNTNARCLPDGNNFIEQMITNVIDIPSHRDEQGRIYIPNADMENGSYKAGCDGTLNYCNNNVASVFLYAGIGPHLGNDALGYTQNNYEQNGTGDFDMLSLANWYNWAKDRTDGSTYTNAGYHYNHDGNEVSHNAGDLVHVYFTANAYLYQAELLENIFSNIAIAGQAVYTRDSRNRLRVVIDKTEKYPVALINQKNILKSSHSISFAELPSGIQVTFPDENDGYEQNQVYRMVDGEDDKNPLGAIEPYGLKYVTNNNQIWFLAGYVLANRILNREIVTVQLGMEGASLSLGDVVLLSDDTMLLGTDLGGRITEVIEDDNYIYGFVINDVYHLTGAENFGVVVMQPSKFKEYRVITLRIASVGTTKNVNGVTYTSEKGKTNTVLLQNNIAKSAFDPNGNDFYVYKPEVGNIVSFGTVGSITDKYRIAKIKPSEKQKYDFTLIKYTEDLYNCGKELPSFQNNMTLPDRSAENKYPLSNNVTQSQLIEAIKESADQAQGVIDNILSKTPSVPSTIAFTVDRDGVQYSCVVNSSDINNVDYIEYQIKRYDNTTVTIKDTYTGIYNFNRNVDGYPEREDLAYWTIKARAVSIFTDSNNTRVMSDWSSEVNISTASLNNYGTWIPATPSFDSKIPSEGGIQFNWSAATGSNSRTLYGTPRYTVTVLYTDADRSISERTFATIRSNTLTVNYEFNRNANYDGYPEKNATDDYKGLNKYTFKLKVENESGSANTRESTASGFSQEELNAYGTWIPAAPVLEYANAEESGIDIKWKASLGLNGRTLYGGVTYKVYVTYDNSGTEQPRSVIRTDGFAGFYTFDRADNKDGYPEKTGTTGASVILGNYKVKLEGVSTNTNRSTVGSNNSVNEDNYKTWIPPEITVAKEIVDRTVILSALYNGNVYGNQKLLVKISRVGNLDIAQGQTTFNELLGIDEDVDENDNRIFYTPEFDKSVQTSSSADNEPNYRKNTTTEYEYVGYKITHTLPLIGQTYRIFKQGNVYTGTFTKDVSDYSSVPQSPTAGLIIHYTGDGETQGGVDFEKGFYYLYEDSAWEQVFSKAMIVPTTYVYSIQMTNESGNLSNLLDDIEVTAQPTNISDIVHSHEHYKDLYVEKLSAINANLGMISQGGMGEFKDWKNFWALSDLTAEDSGVAGGVKKGSFRVGGDDQFLEVMPDPDHEGEYLITLQAGNITLTSGSDASFKQGTYIYDKIDPKKRLALTSTGMIAQQDVSETAGVEDWQNMAEVRTDECGNMIITNSDDSPKVGVQANGSIYHFEDSSHPFYIEGGTTNPQSLSGDGAVVGLSDEDNPIIKTISSAKCYSGNVQKNISSFTGTMVFFSKSNMVKPNDEQMIRITGAVDSTNAKAYNDLMSQTKGSGTVGSYLGLTATQISNRIFTEE